MTQASFINTVDISALDELLARSQTTPVVVFKHSLTCSISASVYKDMADYAGDVALVVVQRARALSDEIAARTGVRHESPQALVLRHGRAVWHASHYDITPEDVQRAVEENQ